MNRRIIFTKTIVKYTKIAIIKKFSQFNNSYQPLCFSLSPEKDGAYSTIETLFLNMTTESPESLFNAFGASTFLSTSVNTSIYKCSRLTNSLSTIYSPIVYPILTPDTKSNTKSTATDAKNTVNNNTHNILNRFIYFLQ